MINVPVLQWAVDMTKSIHNVNICVHVSTCIQVLTFLVFDELISCIMLATALSSSVRLTVVHKHDEMANASSTISEVLLIIINYSSTHQ